METTKAILNRHSTRGFTDQKIPLNKIKELLTLAQSAPSWGNAQPQHIYLATGQALESIRKAYAEKDAHGEHGNPELPVLSGEKWSEQGRNNMASWSEGIGNDLGSDWQNIMATASSKLYNAPAIVFLTLPKDYSLWSLYDLGALGQTLMISAIDQGISTMTAYQLIKYPEVLREALPISEDEVIISGIAIGYRDETAPVNKIKASRQTLDNILKICD